MPPSPPHPAYLSGVIQQFEKCAPTQPTGWEVYLANVTAYYQDTVDLTLLATQPRVDIDTMSLANNNFFPLEVIGDIVRINDDTSVKGLYLSKNLVTKSSPTAPPGTNISDATITGFRHDIFDIVYPHPMQTTPATIEIGSITAAGVSGQLAPGGPPEMKGGDWAITGGTGAFLGATGQMGGGREGGVIRAASVREDPSKRRVNASSDNIATMILYVIPMMPPRIIEVFHDAAGNHPVTHHHPAKANDPLILYATGLGPVTPNVPVGQPFPANARVISPVTVTIGNTTIAPTSAQGFPGSTNGYSVHFIVPQGAFPPVPGTTSIQLTSAWIQSAVGTLYVH